MRALCSRPQGPGQATREAVESGVALALGGDKTGRGGTFQWRTRWCGDDAATRVEVRMLASLTGIGLSAAAGLNAYIPYLLVAVLARFTDVVELPASYAWIESSWSIGISAALLASELVLDKIPVVDHINDAVATLIRPTVGGLIFAATTAAADVDASPWMQENPWVSALLGALVAGVVHTGKTLARPAVTIGTAGLGTPVVSAAEDVTSVSLSLVAIFLPLLVIVMVALLAWAIVAIVRRTLRRRRTTTSTQLGPPG